MLADFCLVLLLVSACVAQGVGSDTTEIRKLRVVRSGDTIRIEIILTHPVNPKLTIATKPDRLVLDLPTTLANSRQRRIVVNRNGVKQVRIGPNGANPPVMRAVVD